MFGILGLGFLLGMRHALEVDHVAAVSSIAARRTDVADVVKHGLTWGIGRTLTLFAFAGAAGLGYVALFGTGSMLGMGALLAVIAVPLALSARWLTWANSGLQGAVGVMTIAIGARTIVETMLA
jgi:hypothetical protein